MIALLKSLLTFLECSQAGFGQCERWCQQGGCKQSGEASGAGVGGEGRKQALRIPQAQLQ